MKKKNYLLLATAAIALVACTADDDLSAGKSTTAQGDGAIVFNMGTSATTREISGNSYTKGDAAGKLNNEFIVWGEKNEGETNYDATKDIVFKNYRVQYKANSANTTVSNTKDWEYVGIKPYEDGTTEKVSPSIYSTTTPTQTIKYWDFGKNYTFTAISAKNGDITSGNVQITKNTTGDVDKKGYTIVLGDGASVGDIYFADRSVVAAPANSSSTISPVTLTFRNFQTQIRFGIYEKVPGYKVVITGIKCGTTPTVYTSNTKGFGVDGCFVKAGSSTKYKVTYTSANKAQVEIEGTPSSETTLTTGGENWLTVAQIGTEATSPTYDLTSAGYTAIQPNPSNSTNLKLQIAYKLVSEDTGEEIVFKDAQNAEIYRTVEVPAAYCQWKSNYAYTYLFKITDKSAELYPITFDAVVELDETGNQETITSVSEPSITTYAVTSTSSNTVVTGKNEYENGNVIYASVVDKNVTGESNLSGGAVKLTKGTNIDLYTVTSTKGSKANAAPEITEKAVANCIANGAKDDDSNPTTWTTTDATESVIKVTKYTGNDCEVVTTVPAEDGGNRTTSALKWVATGQANAETYYVVEYSYSNKKYYKVVKVAKTN